jgi:hypothetical protein
MTYDKDKLNDPNAWRDSERLHRRSMILATARLYNALVREHPEIVRRLQVKNNVTNIFTEVEAQG